uniref:BET1 homolog (Trinotate prediction) n=1 Tax=Myxobolus squamalis TaxID=59785 RepID=A0A6B2G6J2_MYXSQ
MNNPNDKKYRRREIMDEEHEENISGLSERVQSLKSITIDMGNEVRLHNSLLDELRGSVGQTEMLLGATVRRLKMVASRGNHKLLCYVVGFSVLVFFVLYIYLKWK